jgi:hypothetical protein
MLSAPKEKVFSYLSRIENLPRWATEFCHQLKVVHGKHKVITCPAMGGVELFIQIRADQKTGVIDYLAGSTQDQMTAWPARVVELSDGSCAFLFTMFQGPGVTDEQFQGQHESLLREFDNIKREFS